MEAVVAATAHIDDAGTIAVPDEPTAEPTAAEAAPAETTTAAGMTAEAATPTRVPTTAGMRATEATA